MTAETFTASGIRGAIPGYTRTVIGNIGATKGLTAGNRSGNRSDGFLSENHFRFLQERGIHLMKHTLCGLHHRQNKKEKSKKQRGCIGTLFGEFPEEIMDS